ncbi:MAG TPA: lipocalin-like domain-containing protein [Methylomirabilota bacterium]|nr:lipocalin-like domain-containing protein [Methylomirabilota bacterium]
MSRRTRLLGGAALVLLAALAWVAVANGPARPEPDGVQASLAASAALDAGDVTGYARALGPRPLTFPADAGPHPDFRTEWWYYTGNLEAADGRHFGFELTFFRTALAPPGPAVPRGSAWATRQLYLAHFALTDTAGRRFHAWSRLGRAALGLAGADAEPFRVWVDDWSVEGLGAGDRAVRLRAAEAGAAIDLVLESTKPAVLQGDRGWSRKGPEPGNASYYYSLTRMRARGTVRAGDATVPVSGLAWMDREWSTSALGPDLVGWDWVALQLDDGRDLMVYRLRRRDGTADRFSAGTVIAADGTTRPLGSADATLEALGHWTSPWTGVRYPSRWRLTVPSAGLVLDITPRLPDQELRVGTRYWEGAVRVEGTAGPLPVGGRGYVELVGYGE